ncbi:MAG: histidinol-phosphate transaminase [Methanosarcinales archaeon]
MQVPTRLSLKELEEYKPGKLVKGAIKLSSNENPLGPSPKVLTEISDSLKDGRLALSVYPWERTEELLRERLAVYTGMGKANIVIGAGVDGVLDTLVKIFIADGDEAIIPVPTFSLYESLVKIAGGKPKYLTRESDFSISVKDLISAAGEKTRLIFIASPNNPTGNCISADAVRELAQSVPEAMVILDEAYVEFADSSLLKEVEDPDNVLVLRTFSKAFGLAGLRVGYAVVPKWLASMYKRVSMPFTVNSIALIAAMAALSDKEHLRRSVELVKHGRKFLTENLQLKVYPSQANFVLVDVAPAKSYEVYEALLKEGLVVRNCTSFRGAGDSLIRISVGTQQQNEQVVDAFKAF